MYRSAGRSPHSDDRFYKEAALAAILTGGEGGRGISPQIAPQCDPPSHTSPPRHREHRICGNTTSASSGRDSAARRVGTVDGGPRGRAAEDGRAKGRESGAVRESAGVGAAGCTFLWCITGPGIPTSWQSWRIPVARSHAVPYAVDRTTTILSLRSPLPPCHRIGVLPRTRRTRRAFPR